MIPFFCHFFKRLLSRTRVNSKKLIVNQLRGHHQKAALMTNYIKIQIKKRQNSHFPQII